MCMMCGEKGNTGEGRMKEMMQKCADMFHKNMTGGETKQMMECCHAMCASMMSQKKEGKEKKDAV